MFPSSPFPAIRLSTRFVLIFLIVAASAFAAGGDGPRLVKDINPFSSPVSSSPGGYATIGDITYFFAKDAAHGSELWKTDGTEAGTVLVRDIRPGAASGLPTNRYGAPAAGNRVYFQANDGEHGNELWSSDGTAYGTVMLADIVPGTGTSAPSVVSITGTTVYFLATAEATGRELWRTDGTPESTRLVLDFNPGAASSDLRMLGRVGDTVFITATDGTRSGIFTTDWTREGTHFVAPLDASPAAVWNGEVLFTVTTDGEWKLMRTDGTTAGTTVIHDGFKGARSAFALANGTLFFMADDGQHGVELWRTDGTSGGTMLAAELTPGSGGTQVGGLYVLNDKLLFTRATENPGSTLWTSDGTAAGTKVLREFTTYAGSLTIAGNRAYFVSEEAPYGREVWMTDGTPEGTVAVDVVPGPGGGIDYGYLLRRGNGVFFAGIDAHGAGIEPFITDGTAAGTHMLRNVAQDQELGSIPKSLTNVNGRLFFSASDNASTRSLWISSGTEETTTRLSIDNIHEKTAASSGGLYYFGTAGNQSVAVELWRTDGTEAGTIRLVAAPSSGVVPLRGGVFFWSTDAEHGTEPWFSDGSVAGTHLVKDIDAGSSSSNDGIEPLSTGDYVYFVAELALWRTDGTAGGTVRLSDPSLEEARQPRTMVRVGDDVYFTANGNSSGFTLWRTSISTMQTTKVTRLPIADGPQVLWSVGGMLLFAKNGELWRSDGTSAGTVLVATTLPRFVCDSVENFATDGRLLFWSAYRDADFNYHTGAGLELWRSDGTTEGTYPMQIAIGPYSESQQACSKRFVHYSNGRVFFIGNDPIHGAEPWVTDGTSAGTHLLWDVNPGEAASDPAEFETVGDTLYFSATTATAGRELWAVPVDWDREVLPRRRAVRW